MQGYPKINISATAIATPTKAPTGAATSAYSSSQSITAVNGFMISDDPSSCDARA